MILPNSGHELRELLNRLPIGVYRNTPEYYGRFFMANESIAKMFGYETAEEFVKINVLDIYMNSAEGEDLYRMLLSNGFVKDVALRLRKKDGSSFWGSITTQVVRNNQGKIDYFEGVIKDITGRHQEMKEKNAVRQLLQSILDAVPDLLVVIDRDFRIRYTNHKGHDLIEPLEGELGNTCYGCFKRLNAPCEDCSAVPVFAERKTVTREMVNPADGRIREVRAFPIINEEDEVTNVVEHVRDITQQKKMENELVQSHKMEAVGMLAGGIAHDFNNILSAIIGFTELALEDAGSGTDQEEHLQKVLTASNRAKDLVRQILTVARQTDEATKPVQVSSIAKEVLRLIRSSISATIEIRQKINSDSFIMGNPSQIHQIFMNLCTNAAHAIDESGGILEVSLEDVTIDNTSAIFKEGLMPGDYIEIKLLDTGVGIPSDVIGSIFQPYFTTKATGEGTGMGLAVVQGVVEKSSGKIFVESKTGKGTAVRVFLPITKKRDVKPQYIEEDLPAGIERVLFVDDEPAIAKIGAHHLEGLGYSVTIRTSSLEALELFRLKPKSFDLVISDMTMPNKTGYQLAVELIKIRPDIPIILCTGYNKNISDKTAYDIGIKAFLYKPIIKADLAKTVRKVLDEAIGKNKQ